MGAIHIHDDISPLDSTELDFLNTFENMVHDDTPLLQRGNLTEEDMTPVSFVTSLPTPKLDHEPLDDTCVIFNLEPLESIVECPGAPVLNDCSTFNGGSGVGDFDIDWDALEEDDGSDKPQSMAPALELLPMAGKMDYVEHWRFSVTDDAAVTSFNIFLTAGFDDNDSHQVGTGYKRTRSIALSDDVEEPRRPCSPDCLGLSNMHQHRNHHNAPD